MTRRLRGFLRQSKNEFAMVRPEGGNLNAEWMKCASLTSRVPVKVDKPGSYTSARSGIVGSERRFHVGRT